MLNSIVEDKKAKRQGKTIEEEGPVREETGTAETFGTVPPDAPSSDQPLALLDHQIGLATELLGTDTQGLSREDLQSLAQTLPLEEAQEMGLSREEVASAVEELKELAAQDGRDPASVDSAVALEALVGQQELLQEMERQGLELGQDMTQDRAQEMANLDEKLSPSMSLETPEERERSQARDEGMEREMEMEMGGGDAGGD